MGVSLPFIHIYTVQTVHTYTLLYSTVKRQHLVSRADPENRLILGSEYMEVILLNRLNFNFEATGFKSLRNKIFFTDLDLHMTAYL